MTAEFSGCAKGDGAADCERGMTSRFSVHVKTALASGYESAAALTYEVYG